MTNLNLFLEENCYLLKAKKATEIKEKYGITKKLAVSTMQEIEQKRHERKSRNFQRKNISLKQRLNVIRKNRLVDALKASTNISNFGIIDIKFNGKNEIEHSKCLDFSGYSKSYGHAMTLHSFVLNMPTKIKNSQTCYEKDEAGIYIYHKSRNINNIFISKRIYIVRKKSEYIFQEMFFKIGRASCRERV